ncbi:RNA polymerase sigma factor [Spirosoma oryzicola]|uniref:RNA polymerase sigma factor n=1 Tax=Spirosoma oryzicola TaxID=2898794 RepID=UPI001E4F57D5|nr:sigma-70 family RNA polymerase sigma factor [Spirosoma oryzicola]UHG89243.1 sigma-70 family RNA polymerase sigma factor [Spirosoma oryzicola]
MKLTLNDEEVIRQFYTTRPNDCFETLYTRYVSKVYNRCLSLTKDSDKAQDFTHDIFLKMFAHLDRFEQRSSFSTWLYSISYNYCMDQLRIDSRMAVSTIDENRDDDSDAVDNQFVSVNDSEELEESLLQLSRVMNKITPEESMILRLKYQEGLDIRQIASRLQLNDSAVKMRLKRSRDKVRHLCAMPAFAR